MGRQIGISEERFWTKEFAQRLFTLLQARIVWIGRKVVLTEVISSHYSTKIAEPIVVL
jgi:hypothetical protein